MARGKGDGALFKDARGYWTATVELEPALDGRRRRKTVRRKNKAVALAELNELKKEFAKHGDLSTSSTTVEKWATHWLEEIAPRDSAPNSMSGYRNQVNSYIVPLLGRKRLDKLTAVDVRRFHARIQELPKTKKIRALDESKWPADCEKLGAATAVTAHSVLSTVLGAAFAEGRVGSNACEIAGPPEVMRPKPKALTVQQAARLLAYVASHPDAAMWSTYILTGARRGEVLGLEADRIGEDTIDLSWQLQNVEDPSQVPASYEMRFVRGNLYLVRPKSDAGWRILPLVEPLKSVLKLHLQGKESEDGLIFLNRAGEAWHPTSVSTDWRKILAEAKIPADVKLHGARHTVVDLLYDAGVPESTIQQIVGHSNVDMTRKYKTRVNQGPALEALEAMSKFIKDA